MKSETTPTASIPDDLLLAQRTVYDTCGFQITQLTAEAESAAYGAFTFKLNGLHIIYRIAKITPTKTGQFVTLWKRSGNGPIEPYHTKDKFDYCIVSVSNGKQVGQFVFPKAVLLEKGVLSDNQKEGKRAIRVYPPWDHAASKQALKTQAWQLNYFLEIPASQPIDLSRVNSLFNFIQSV